MTGTSLTLRPYQQEAVAAVEAAHQRGVRRPLLVMATGLGKTVVAAALIARRGGSALVLAHRDELLQQAAAKIRLADPELGMAVGFVAGGRDDVGAPVVIGSVQTLARERRLARLPQDFDTVFLDFTSRPLRVRLVRSWGWGAGWPTRGRRCARERLRRSTGLGSRRIFSQTAQRARGRVELAV